MDKPVSNFVKDFLIILCVCILYFDKAHGAAPEINGIIPTQSQNDRDKTGTLLIYPKYSQELLLVGGNFSDVEGQAQIAFTSNDNPNGKCDDYAKSKPFDLHVVPSSGGKYAKVTVELTAPTLAAGNGNITASYLYICSKGYIRTVNSGLESIWVHQGIDSAVRVAVRPMEPPRVVSILSSETDSSVESDGSLLLYSGSNQNIVLTGHDFDQFGKQGQIAFTTKERDTGSCEFSLSDSFNFTIIDSHYATASIRLNNIGPGNHYYLCLRNPHSDGDWVHQGSDVSAVKISVRVREKKTTILPLWMQIIFIAFLLVLSGLFSGLNLGLMALDKTELKIIERCGSKNEKKYAKKISPVRKRGNFLLCTLLLGNVLVNNTLTILLDDLSNGIIAVITATMGIVVFGEIIPQAVCSRHGLAVGARTIWITRFFMVLTFPLSFPISLLLDKILGEEIGHVYDREKLQELIRVTKDFSELKNDEVNIIAGALELTKKTVVEVMTKIEDVFSLDINSKLDFDTIAEIQKRGYTRIPVFEGDRSNITHLLNVKDLTLLDPDDKTPLRTVLKFYQHPLIYVFDDLKLDAMLCEFRQGHSHMAVIRRVNSEGEGDPYYETLGVLTLEDVIEEIIQSEIIDETDTLTDNRQKKKRRIEKQDFSMFINPEVNQQSAISSQLAMAAYQFLSTSVDLFKEELVAPNVLKKLIKQNVYEDVVTNEKKVVEIYQENVPCDFFILLLEGHVEVSIGKEHLHFDGGPFSYYGVQALEVNAANLAPQHSADNIYLRHFSYIPDFTLKATSTITYVKIRRAHYIASRKITLISKSTFKEEEENEAYDREMQKASWLTNVSNNSDLLIVDKKSLAQFGRTSSNPSLPVNKVRSESMLSGRSVNSDINDELKPLCISENYVYQNSAKKEDLEEAGNGDSKDKIEEGETIPMMNCSDKDNVPLTKC